MRRYVTIRPNDAEEAGPSSPLQDEKLNAKRRRVGVTVACNACRRKKIRCNGQRPTCSNCETNNGVCTYRDDSEISQESQLLLLQVVRQLNAVPKDEAVGKLQSLKNEVDTSVIMSTLRDNEGSRSASRDPTTPISHLEDAFQVLELSAQNPNAFPILPSPDVKTLSEDAYQQLIQPMKRRRSFYAKDSHDHRESEKTTSLCDPRLSRLDISRWSNVHISNEFAARAISLYLETDHPLLGFFDPDLFVSDLVSGSSQHCSSLLVNSLLYWAAQMHRTESSADCSTSLKFCAEAEQLWGKEKHVDSTHNVIAAFFLSLGYLGQGRDHSVLAYFRNASHMAVRLGLFGVEDERAQDHIAGLSIQEGTAWRLAAWGSFNWATHMALFYRQPGLPCPESPPRFPVPETRKEESGEDEKRATKLMDGIFPDICDFWCILHEVALRYSVDGDSSATDDETLRFAEYKFRELLAWMRTNAPMYMIIGTDLDSIWLHAAILDLFRHTVPGSHRHCRLRTFSNLESSPDKVCMASVNQLKQLIVNYRSNFASASYTILWHMALTYLANDLLYNPKDDNWFFYFQLCLYGYERLCPCWRVAKAIARALLSLAIRKGDISSSTARQVWSNIERNSMPDLLSADEDVRATFMADLNLAESDPESATVEKLAADFEQNILLQEYTNVLDSSPHQTI
ncbi:hypothetical protein ED733_004393 [Metarhizium rileyi]|uniref:Zn(2)-C6 fungal-type domain-containing protein n=1 Tax=Metarhizium rileyi (strain RCEF 4871) TaxID=1649241 RepID=A0A5C6G9E4_METRR|nr:hypothetical protein ED733_004393 [Metarhizium rileyi]